MRPQRLEKQPVINSPDLTALADPAWLARLASPCVRWPSSTGKSWGLRGGFDGSWWWEGGSYPLLSWKLKKQHPLLVKPLNGVFSTSRLLCQWCEAS